jgi:hypothetical protein
MALKAKRQDKVRVQVDLTAAEATLLELLQRRLSVRSRADVGGFWSLKAYRW